MKKRPKAKKSAPGKAKPIVTFHLKCMDVDNYGRVVIKDPKLARMIKKLKKQKTRVLAANSYCLPDSFCPPPVSGGGCGGHTNIGCGCPRPDSMCTCVAQCGCQLTLCNCA